MSGKTMETFNDMTPIEPSAAVSDNVKEGMDTFDNPEPIVPESKEEDGAKSEEKEEKETSDQPLKDKQINQLDDEEAEKGKEDKKSDGEADKDEDEEEGDSGKEGEEKDGEKPVDKGDDEPKKSNKKVIKGRVGDETYELDPDTEIRVPIKGKREPVKLQELMNNYSGSKNWDREYSKLGEEKNQIKKEKEAYQGELNWLKGHIDKVVDILDGEDNNPADALMYFLDVTGRDPIQYQQKMYNSQLEMLQQMEEMDEVEKELFWERKKNESLLKRQESVSNRQKAQREHHELVAKVDKLRKAHDVSEEQYVTAHKELVDLGFDQLQPEQVVDYAVKLPFIIKAEGLVEDYKSEIDPEDVGKLVSDITSSLLDGLEEQEIEQLLVETYGTDDDLEDLNQKIQTPRKVVDDRPANEKLKYAPNSKEGRVESFEDFGYL